MPIYEYECSGCGKITEAMQRFSDDPLTSCEHCGGELRRLISQSTFHLKGSGWYVTDYARKCSTSTSGSSGSSASSSTASSPAEKAEKKPKEAAEPKKSTGTTGDSN